MNRLYRAAMVLVMMVLSNSTLAVVNESSDAYTTGYLIGRIFIAILAILIIRKIFFGKKS